jgi:hypothetical protein
MAWVGIDKFGKNLIDIGIAIVLLAVLYAILWRK